MNNNDNIKPFLRWAGGKTWLVKSILELVDGKEFTGYLEPFIGGASVFFSLKPQTSILSDSNADLINVYQCIKESPDAVFEILTQFENNSDAYYAIRSSSPVDRFERAARFIYLNQTSFNGLYRVNRKGEYNVPYGKRKNVSFSLDNLNIVSDRLTNALLIACDFEETILRVKQGNLVYLDPPYVVAKDDKSFIGYNQQLFSIEDQKRLSKCIDYIKSVGAYYILSNAKHETILSIFDKGDSVIEVQRTSLIGGKNAYRGKIHEYLFTNLK